MQLSEPACDLAVCAALVSSLQNRPLEAHTLVLGEVGRVHRTGGYSGDDAESEVRIAAREILHQRRHLLLGRFAPAHKPHKPAAETNRSGHLMCYQNRTTPSAIDTSSSPLVPEGTNAPCLAHQKKRAALARRR